MSVSLWNWSELCEYKPCCGDCDLCNEGIDYVRLAEVVESAAYDVLGVTKKNALHAAAELIERMANDDLRRND